MNKILTIFAVVIVLATATDASAQGLKHGVEAFVVSWPGGTTDRLARLLLRYVGVKPTSVKTVKSQHVGKLLSTYNPRRERPLPLVFMSNANAPRLRSVVQDLAPVAVFGSQELVLLTNMRAKAPDFKAVRPNKSSPVVVGVGSALGELVAMEVLAEAKVPISFESTPVKWPSALDSGKLTAVVVPGPRRRWEANYRVYEAASPLTRIAYGMFGPIGLDDSVVTDVNKRLARVLGLPEVKKGFEDLGVRPEPGKGQDLRYRFDTVDTKFCKTCVCKTSKRCRRLCKKKCKS